MIVKILQYDIDESKRIQKERGDLTVSFLGDRTDGPLATALRRMGFENIDAGMSGVQIDGRFYPLGDDYGHFMMSDKQFGIFQESPGIAELKIRGIKPASINIKGLEKPG